MSRLLGASCLVVAIALAAPTASATDRRERDLIRTYLPDFVNLCYDALDSGRCDSLWGLQESHGDETPDDVCREVADLVDRCEDDRGRRDIACRVFEALRDDACEDVDDRWCDR